MNKKILVFKNDRSGDLFTSIKAIDRILKKHNNDEIIFYLSDLNHKFSFLFPNIIKKIIPIKLTILNKLKIILFFIKNKIDTVYILKPKNFYFWLSFFFRKTKFYGITIKSKKKTRPNNFLLRYLHKRILIDRTSINKRLSTYIQQENLIEDVDKANSLINMKYEIRRKFELPDKYIFFHYKHKLFNELLDWELKKTLDFIKYLSTKSEKLLFSSEFCNEEINKFFQENYNTYDYTNNKNTLINDNNIIFLKNIDGLDLYDVINHSTNVIAPEGIMPHIAYFLKKKPIALLYFILENKNDLNDQIISCKEWFPPDNFKYIILKKDLSKTIKKIEKRLK